MAKALESVTTFLGPLVTGFWTRFWNELGRPGLDPSGWSTLTWSVAVFVALLFALGFRLLGRRRARGFPAPELIISKGEVVQLENSILQQLSVKVSNLGDYSVQLLEFTLSSAVLPEPVLIEAIELLRPHTASELKAILPTDLVGDDAVLKAYGYVARNSERVFELRANLEWEPWNKRYKVSPMGQSLRPARKLDSTRLDELRKRAWLEYNPNTRPEPPRAPSRSPRPNLPRVPTRVGKPSPPELPDERRAVAKKGELEFPNEF